MLIYIRKLSHFNLKPESKIYLNMQQITDDSWNLSSSLLDSSTKSYHQAAAWLKITFLLCFFKKRHL